MKEIVRPFYGDTSMNNWYDNIKQSHEEENWEEREKIYKQLFPDMAALVCHPRHEYWQEAGIDWSIILKSSKQIKVDEKIRYEDYGDILLEYVSNDKTGDLGWVAKPLLCDIIVYIVKPPNKMCKVFLLNVLQLQAAWMRYGEDWKIKYGIKRAENKGYWTLNVAVPVKELYQSMAKICYMEFTQKGIEWDKTTSQIDLEGL